jgi:hypothetical protein
MSHRLPAVIGALLAVVLALPGAAAANERIWTLLKGGGQLVLVRHAITTPGVGDPPGMRLDDGSSAISSAGRRTARARSAR